LRVPERLGDRFGERPRWKPAAVAVAIAAALAVAVMGSGGTPARTSSAGESDFGASVVTGDRQVPPAAATAAARRFLAGYLPFLYGQGGRGALSAVTPRLRRWLGAHPARQTPAERDRHPRLVALTFTPGTCRGLCCSRPRSPTATRATGCAYASRARPAAGG
jgi:hypothetical protein